MMILIDCDPIMFTTTTTKTATTLTTNRKKNDDDTSRETTQEQHTTYIHECINAIQKVVQNKIRTVTIYKAGKRDGIGLLLYNTKFRNPIVPTVTASSLDHAEQEQNEEDDEDEDDDDDNLLFGHHASSSFHRTNVHEFLPLEPPGVSTMERIKSVSVLPSTSVSASSASHIDLQHEYCVTSSINSTNNDDEDNDIQPLIQQQQQLPPLVYALRKALSMFQEATCVKKTRATSAGKWEEPDSKHIWILTPHDDPCYTSTTSTSTDDTSNTKQSKKGVISDDERRNEMIRILRECVSDVQENDIQIHVWPIAVKGTSSSTDTTALTSSFDRSIFYDSITADTHNHDIETSDDWVNSLDAVYKKTRPAYRVPFLLPNWKEKFLPGSTNNNDTNQGTTPQNVLYLDFYNVHQIQKEPSVLPIHQSTGKLLGKVRQLITVDDGGGHILAEKRSYDPASKKSNPGTYSHNRQLCTYFEFGNEYIPFSLRDKAMIKKQCNVNPNFASLVLLGFKPATAIPFYHTVEKSYFAYPSESTNRTNSSANKNSGSSSSSSVDAIAHLHVSMIRLNVIGIGELLTRATATSRLVVIRPIAETLRPVISSNDGDTENEEEVYMLVRPPGLLISAIPFEDEMRMMPASYSVPPDGNDQKHVSEEMIEAAMNVIEKQTFQEEIEIGADFANAAMNRFWNYIEHIAYNEDTVKDEVRYDSELNVTEVFADSVEQIETFLALLPEATEAEKVASSGRKRKAAPASSKKPAPEDDSGLDWSSMVQRGTLSKCTVAVLKSKLRSIGEPVNGNKPEVCNNHVLTTSFLSLRCSREIL
jgi:Ku70/Ku80 beta-barrel domain